MKPLLMFCVTLAVLCAGMALAQNVTVNGNFQAFGSARLVVGGVPPDSMALDLTSNCGAQAYSNTCYNNAPFTYSGVDFHFSHHPALSKITTLSTDYNYGGADCGGGAPRLVIFTTTSDNFEGYLGPPPEFTNCYYGWLNTGNLTADSSTRWVFDNGNTLMTWSQLVASYGTDTLTDIEIVVDSGWITPRGQDVMIDNFTIDNKVMQPSNTVSH